MARILPSNTRALRLYGLPWQFPGWVANDPQSGAHNDSGSPFDHPEQTTRYVMEWVKGAKSEYGPLHKRSVAHPFLLAAFLSKFIGEQ